MAGMRFDERRKNMQDYTFTICMVLACKLCSYITAPGSWQASTSDRLFRTCPFFHPPWLEVPESSRVPRLFLQFCLVLRLHHVQFGWSLGAHKVLTISQSVQSNSERSRLIRSQLAVGPQAQAKKKPNEEGVDRPRTQFELLCGCASL